MSRPVVIALLALLTATSATALGPPAPEARAQGPEKKRKVMKTDAEWARILTPQQFLVTRRKATEPAFTGKYANNHARGTYLCVCCEAELFSSQAKFDSGTGWPSFWRPVDPKKLETAPDYHQAEPRIEVLCESCGAHLGHVFDDGPPPTGLRFCINSASLKFVPATAAKVTAKGKAAAKGKARPKEEPAEPSPGADSPSNDR